MPRRIAGICCLLLTAVLLLTGCSVGLAQHPTETIPREAVITNAGLSFTLTTDFVDFTDTQTNDGAYDFLCSDSDHHVILGWKDEKAALAKTYGALTLQQYADLTAAYYDLDIRAEEKDGFYTFIYSTPAGDGSNILFTCLFLETENAFWNIQGSCPEAHFEADRDQIWAWLTSVTPEKG